MTSPAPEIADAVILMAGTGSRLAAGGAAGPKPLLQIGGRPLISYTIAALVGLRVRKIHAVVGANADVLVDGLRAAMPANVALNVIVNPEAQKQNGVSALCAAEHVAGPFFLTMGDHLFEPSILLALSRADSELAAQLAIDRKISTVFDLDDAMKVQTRDGYVTAIAKELETYDAIDTGVFLCRPLLFDYLCRARVDGDCSLADGMRLAAADRDLGAVDIGEAWWQDVDTPEMLRQAELHCARLR